MSYTLKIKFSKWGKVYHFASMKHMGKAGEKVNVIKKDCHKSLDKYESVIIVGHEDGISPKATKWRTGSPVTQEQRVKYPQHIYKKENTMSNSLPNTVEDITASDIRKACHTLLLIQRSDKVNHFGFSLEGNLFYQVGCGQTNSMPADNYQHVEALVEVLKEDPRKKSLQKSLDELLAKAEEIKTQIKEM